MSKKDDIKSIRYQEATRLKYNNASYSSTAKQSKVAVYTSLL